MSSHTKLAEMLCTRFCHDIIGPVGAVSNGAEFLREEMKDVQSQAADLIESSSKEAVARIQFYRQAYGMGATGSPASLTEMKELTKNYFSFGKIKLDWNDKFTDMSGVELTHGQKKIILNLFIVAASALIRGGSIKFEVTKDEAKIIASSEVIKLDPNYEACLKGKINESEIEPRLVQVFYTRKLIEESGKDLGIEKLNESLTLTAKL